MSDPFPASQLDPDSRVISPRFAVAQGEKPDGSPEIRPIDAHSRSQVNEHARAQEKVSRDAADHLVSVARQFMSRAGAQPSFCQTDVDAAYRRAPLRPEHRLAAHVAFVVNGAAMVAQRWATPFGGRGGGLQLGATRSVLGALRTFAPLRPRAPVRG